MQKIVIFGTGDLAQRIFYYLKNSEDEVVAFSANKSNIESDKLLGLPVVGFENVEKEYPPEEFSMFICDGRVGNKGFQNALFPNEALSNSCLWALYFPRL